uniref:Uncharacterized protein n=1 Tax=Cacopsylla melanoneura TaxID=428564 RepID=A0A8D8WP77_9HEMI
MSKVTLLSCVEIKVSDVKVDKIIDTWTSLGDPRDYEHQDDLKFDFYTHIHDLGSALFDCLRQADYTLNEQRRNSLHDLFVPYGVALDRCEMDTVQSCVFSLVVEGLKKTILQGECFNKDTDSIHTRNGTSYLLLAEFIKSYSQHSSASSSDSSHHNSYSTDSSHNNKDVSTDSLFIQSLLRSIQCGTLKSYFCL